MEMRLMGAGLFHADRWTGTTKLIVALRSSANALKYDCPFESPVFVESVNIVVWYQIIEFRVQ
jgi:hypothetical protein